MSAKKIIAITPGSTYLFFYLGFSLFLEVSPQGSLCI